MKYAAIIIGALVFAGAAHAAKYVDGYVKKDGTYVQGHYKTERNDTQYDNYSTKGNTNPYTGKKGSKNPSN